jgi:DNA modification methylase
MCKREILLGDCLELMGAMPDNSVDAVVTDPPYGLSFMGKKWDYDVPGVGVWQEALRVLKPGGYLLAFAGTRTQHRMAVNIEDAGFEIRDMIMWVYGSGFPKSLNIGKAVDKLQWNDREDLGEHPNAREALGDIQICKKNGSGRLIKGTSEWEGWGTALKPACEPITVARKPLSESTVADNCLKWGTGGINIEECRVGVDRNNERKYDKEKASGKTQSNHTNLYGLSENKRNDNWLYRGRFPANLIHDGSDEVVGLFPNTKSTGGWTERIANEIYGGGRGTNTGKVFKPHADSGSAARFFYCAKASKSERNQGCEGMEDKISGGMAGTADQILLTGGGNIRNNMAKNNHPTVKPIALMEYLIKLVSREGAIILDPFGGSGTTALACINLNRQFVVMEKDEQYIEIINARVGAKLKEKEWNLFGG